MLPIQKSLDPYNDYRLRCEALNRGTSYKLCLHIIEAVEKATVGDRCKECQVALKSGSCPAKKMREEELAAGASLYYVESPLKALHAARNGEPTSESAAKRPTIKNPASYERGYRQLDRKPVVAQKAPERVKRSRPAVAPGHCVDVHDPFKELLHKAAKADSERRARVISPKTLRAFILQPGIKESEYAVVKYSQQ